MEAYTRCLRCVGAPRRPASGSGPSLHIPSWHAVLSDPTGDSDKDIVSELRCRHSLRRLTNGRLGTSPRHSSNPFHTGVAFRGFTGSRFGLPVARPPARRRIGQWLDLVLFAGLPPARMELASLHGQYLRYGRPFHGNLPAPEASAATPCRRTVGFLARPGLGRALRDRDARAALACCSDDGTTIAGIFANLKRQFFDAVIIT
jgi:hypothetical protein